MKRRPKSVNSVKAIVTLVVLFIFAAVFFYFSVGFSYKKLLVVDSAKPSPELKRVAKFAPPSEFHAWIAWWDEANGLQSLNKNYKSFQSVSPLWYKINPSGTIEKIPTSLESNINTLSIQHGLKLIPIISNDFDPNRVSLILNNTDISASLIENLKTLALNSSYAGLDIDWEEIKPQDQVAFTEFIQRLAGVMHQADLSLTISVQARTGKDSDRAVVKGYDLAALSKSADSLKIMAYDFHSQNSTPGAITPFSDLTGVLEYASDIIPAEKLILGLPTYGYDWAAGKKADIVSFKQANDRIKANGGQTNRDAESNSLVGNYQLSGQKHAIWFEDAQTIQKMIQLARFYGVYQFSFWRVGPEDPSLWAVIK